MARKGEETREKILTVAEGLILQKGFSATAIDEIIKHTSITKGGFFYHFSGKNDLARALMQRYLVQDEIFFNELFSQAHDLSEEPLQQMLIFVKLLANTMANLPDVHPGCLVASFAYEDQQLDEEVKALAAEGMLSWRALFLEQLERIAEKHPPKLAVSLEEVADMLTATIEGGVIISRVLRDQQALVQQLLQYRNYLRLLFNDV